MTKEIEQIVKSLIGVVNWLIGQLEEFKEREKIYSSALSIDKSVDAKPKDEPFLITIHNHTDLDVEVRQDPETGKVSINMVGGGGDGGNPGPGYQTFKSSGEWYKPPEITETIITAKGGRGPGSGAGLAPSEGGGGGEKNPAFDNDTMDRIREKCPQLPSDGEDEEEVDGPIDGVGRAASILHKSILSDWDECVALTQPIRNDGCTAARLNFVRRRIKRSLDEMLDLAKEIEHEVPEPTKGELNKPWAHPSIIFIDLVRGTEGLLYATSPQVPGLFVAKRTIADIKEALPRAIGELYALSIKVEIR